MGMMDKLFGKTESVEVPNLEEIMEAEGDVINPPADFYVKKVPLRNEGDTDLAIKEMADKNIIILDVSPLKKQPNRLRGIIVKLKQHTNKVNGDVKIVKSKPKVKKEGAFDSSAEF
jgi:SepF-like predicted cell division protein (DUF552 family)